jgi:hypothetical protein
MYIEYFVITVILQNITSLLTTYLYTTYQQISLNIYPLKNLRKVERNISPGIATIIIIQPQRILYTKAKKRHIYYHLDQHKLLFSAGHMDIVFDDAVIGQHDWPLKEQNIHPEV